MARPTSKPISDKAVSAAVRRARAEGRRLALSVGGEAGLQLRVSPSGESSYALRYRVAGVQRTVVFKGYPAVTLADARRHARKLLSHATVGTDPWQAKRDAKAAEVAKRQATDRTLERVVALWLESRESKEWRPGTRHQFERITRKNVLPLLGDRDPNDITRGEVRKLIDDIADGKGRKRGPAKREANHTLATVRLVYNWCHAERQEHLGITAAPCAGLKATPEVPRDRVYSNDEIRRVLASDGEGPVADLVGLLFHTGTRDEETRAMRWADLDLERQVWSIQSDVTKNARKHEVMLSSGALAILRRIRERKVTTLSPFVFPADTATGYMVRPLSNTLRAIAIKAALLRNVGTDEAPRYEGDRLRLHDIRRTVGDRLRGVFGDAVMHAALGHAELRLTRTYGPTPRLAVIAEAMQWWSDELAKILSATPAEARA